MKVYFLNVHTLYYMEMLNLVEYLAASFLLQQRLKMKIPTYNDCQNDFFFVILHIMSGIS